MAAAFYLCLDTAASECAFHYMRDVSGTLQYAPGKGPDLRCADAESNVVKMEHGPPAGGPPNDRDTKGWVVNGKGFLVKAGRQGRFSPVVKT